VGVALLRPGELFVVLDLESAILAGVSLTLGLVGGTRTSCCDNLALRRLAGGRLQFRAQQRDTGDLWVIESQRTPHWAGSGNKRRNENP
jgi:hypothetical protein